MTLTLTILAMAALTYALRLAGFALPTGRLAPYWRRWLDVVPITVFSALVAASVPGRDAADTLLRLACLALGAALLVRRMPLALVLLLALPLYLLLRAWVG